VSSTVDYEFQEWWGSQEVQREIRSIRSLTGASPAEASLILLIGGLTAVLACEVPDDE
jgi:hypothetical protein